MSFRQSLKARFSSNKNVPAAAPADGTASLAVPNNPQATKSSSSFGSFWRREPSVDPAKLKPADFDSRTTYSNGKERLILSNNLLQEADSLLLIDDSGSMAGYYWSLVQSELAKIADVLVQNDPDGIDLFFLNHESKEKAIPEEGRPATGYLKIQNPDYVIDKFNSVEPCGGTPTGERLGLILEAYVKLCKSLHKNNERPRPLNIIVFTDGVSNRERVKSAIVGAAKGLDEINAPGNQCGIQFFQIGNEWGVDTWLKQLDDDLQNDEGLTRDMVDTKKYADIEEAGGFTAQNLLYIMLGALSKRHDKKTL